MFFSENIEFRNRKMINSSNLIICHSTNLYYAIYSPIKTLINVQNESIHKFNNMQFIFRNENE